MSDRPGGTTTVPGAVRPQDGAHPFTAEEVAETRALLRRAASDVVVAAGTRVERVPLGGREAVRVRPASGGANGTLLLAHGGGYRAGTPEGTRGVASYLAAGADVEVLLPDYRLAPEHPAPAGRDDVLAAYRALLDDGADPARVSVGGLSAGGGLALGAVLAARAEGLPAPASLVLVSPWVDLTVTAASFRANAATDPILDREDARRAALTYAGTADPATPSVSPLFAGARALAALPPTLIQASNAEVLIDDATRLSARIHAAGGDVVLQTWDDVIHCWHVRVPALPAAGAAVSGITQFLLSRHA